MSAKKIELPMEEIVSLYNEGHSCSDIAKIFHCSAWTINARIDESGVEKRKGRSNIAREKCSKRMSKLRGSETPNWQGGSPKKSSSGYISAYQPMCNGRGLQHRVVIENARCRPLPKGSVVHHADKNRSNNELNNLIVLQNQSAHVRLHRAMDKDPSLDQIKWLTENEITFEFYGDVH